MSLFPLSLSRARTRRESKTEKFSVCVCVCVILMTGEEEGKERPIIGIFFLFFSFDWKGPKGFALNLIIVLFQRNYRPLYSGGKTSSTSLCSASSWSISEENKAVGARRIGKDAFVRVSPCRRSSSPIGRTWKKRDFHSSSHVYQWRLPWG